MVSEKGLPATKVTGKWLFPRHLVEQRVESHIPNASKISSVPSPQGVLVLAGSHDLLLDRVLRLLNRRYPEHLTVFGNVGSLGGVKAFRQGLCQIASSHLLQADEEDYNFEFLLLSAKQRFFQPDVQLFLNLLHDDAVRMPAEQFGGYDLSSCGQVMFPYSILNEDS